VGLAKKPNTRDTRLAELPCAQSVGRDHSRPRGPRASRVLPGGARGLYVFKHDSELGNAHAHALFDRVKVGLKEPGSLARDFGAYSVKFDGRPIEVGASIQAAPGVTLTRRC
jgi:CRISPR-associated protein Csd2